MKRGMVSNNPMNFAMGTLQGVSTQTCILHFALMGRNMQASFGLKVFWESWIVEFLRMTLGFGQK